MTLNITIGLAEQIGDIAKRAGEVIMKVYTSDFNVAAKGDKSPVTEADTKAENLIFCEIRTKIGNDIPLVGEESVAAGKMPKIDDKPFWLIDPLDGTKEFIARNGEFTVNIALIEDGLCVLGVVYAPAIDALYWGGAGLGGVRCMGGQTAAIKVATSNLGKASRVVASKSHLNEATRSLIDRLGEVSLVQAGSSLKFCRVAEGEADIYPRLAPTCEWDTAAAQAVLEGAGGVVLDLQGMPLLYGKPDVLNPSFIATRDTALIPA